MTQYRIYGLTIAGHIAWAIDAVCKDDAEACSLACIAPKPEREREVWRGTERVGLMLRQLPNPGPPPVQLL